MDEKKIYPVHVFVCTNNKEKGECCGSKESMELRNRLKSHFKKNPELKKKVRINSSGCLGQCSKGIAVVCYPDSEWKLNVSLEDFNSLKNWITEKIEKV